MKLRPKFALLYLMVSAGPVLADNPLSPLPPMSNWACRTSSYARPYHDCKAYGFTEYEARRNFRYQCGWQSFTEPVCHLLGDFWPDSF